MKITSFLAIMFVFVGCVSSNTPQVQTIKQWEGHFMNTNDFYNATTNIILDKSESIWVLSNSTLNRFLSNMKGK